MNVIFAKSLGGPFWSKDETGRNGWAKVTVTAHLSCNIDTLRLIRASATCSR